MNSFPTSLKKAKRLQQNTRKTGRARKVGEGTPKPSHIPGSNGHSFSLANSAGVFPVRTQFELRSMMGILFKVKQTNKKVNKHRLGHKKHREHMTEGPASPGTMLEDVRKVHESARKTQDFPDKFSGTDNKTITAMAQLRRE